MGGTYSQLSGGMENIQIIECLRQNDGNDELISKIIQITKPEILEEYYYNSPDDVKQIIDKCLVNDKIKGGTRKKTRRKPKRKTKGGNEEKLVYNFEIIDELEYPF